MSVGLPGSTPTKIIIKAIRKHVLNTHKDVESVLAFKTVSGLAADQVVQLKLGGKGSGSFDVLDARSVQHGGKVWVIGWLRETGETQGANPNPGCLWIPGWLGRMGNNPKGSYDPGLTVTITSPGTSDPTPIPNEPIDDPSA